MKTQSKRWSAGGLQCSLSSALWCIKHSAKTIGVASLFTLALAGCGGDKDKDETRPTSSSSGSWSTPATPSSSTPNSSAVSGGELVYAINAGGPRYNSVDGITYQADEFNIGGDPGETQDPIGDTLDSTLYQTERWGEFSYELPVDDGFYHVKLQFVEMYWTAIGERVMDVRIEGEQVLSDFDIYAVAQRDNAYELEFTNIQVIDGALTIDFSASIDNGQISAIVVKTAGGSGGGSHSSSSSSVSAPGGMVGNAAAGKVAFEDSQNQCVLCHGVFENNEWSNGDRALYVEQALNKYPTQELLATYIRDAMPPVNSEAICGQECADDIAAYLFYLNDAPAQSSSSASSLSNPGSGDGDLDAAQLYQAHGCLSCHGNDGMQQSQPIVFSNYSLQTLITKIDETMPPANPSSCTGECATAVAEHLWSMRPQQASCDDEQVLPRRLRPLTKFEYINTINDLFDRTDGEILASTVGSDTVVRGFDNNVAASGVTSARLDGYWSAASEIADVANVRPWLNTHNCSRQAVSYCFVENFGREAFRRELTNEEKTDYEALFNEAGNDEAGARYVVQAMLISPNFLYRTELGENGRLDQYEIASLLSYTFWGSMPDGELLERARNNGLSNAQQLRQVVEQMIASPQARKQFIHFGRQWLNVGSVQGLDRDRNLFPDFTADVALAMDAEVDLFLQEMLLQGEYDMSDFFASGFTFANDALADFYGLTGVSGRDMQMVQTMGSDNRGGVLTLGALLARNSKVEESHPIERGLLVRQNLLCQVFSNPPADIGEIEPFDPSKPTRERFNAHTSQEGCASCHQYIDEIGFAFENYDAVGRYRVVEANGDAVDASGQVSGLARMTDPDTYMFMNLQELSDIFATDGLIPTSTCLAEQFQRMMVGVAEPDNCAVNNTVARWNPEVNSIKDLWVEIVASQSFTRRQ